MEHKRQHLDEPEADRGDRDELRRDVGKPGQYETDRPQDFRHADEEQE